MGECAAGTKGKREVRSGKVSFEILCFTVGTIRETYNNNFYKVSAQPADIKYEYKRI